MGDLPGRHQRRLTPYQPEAPDAGTAGGPLGITREIRYSARRARLARDLAAVSAGTMAIVRAATRTPAARAPMSQPGSTGTGTTPTLRAKARQITRPTARPSGTPIAMPATATAPACHSTTAAIWRRTN